jgi:hypothetical protein
MMQITREQIVAAARSLIGVPFRWQSNDPAFGLDCRGFVRCVLDRLDYARGVDLTSYSHGAKDTRQLLDYLGGIMDEVEPAESMPGDFPVLITAAPSYHCGIWTRADPLWITHAHFLDRRRHGVMEQPYSGAQLGQIVKVFRLRGLTA